MGIKTDLPTQSPKDTKVGDACVHSSSRVSIFSNPTSHRARSDLFEMSDNLDEEISPGELLQRNEGSCSFSQLSIKQEPLSSEYEEPPIDESSCEGPISEDEEVPSSEEEEPPIDPPPYWKLFKGPISEDDYSSSEEGEPPIDPPPAWEGFPDSFAAWGIPSCPDPNAVWEPPKFSVPPHHTLPPPPRNDKGQLLSLQRARPGVECDICGDEHWTSGCPYWIRFPLGGRFINHRAFKVVCDCNRRVVDFTKGCNSGNCLPGRPMRVVSNISLPDVLPFWENTSI